MANDQDSLLNDLVKLIPGYGAYREQESRRADDRATRGFLSKRLNDCKAALDRLALRAVELGDLELSARLDKVRRELELARTRITSAVEGYAGWFSSRRVDAKLLTKVAEVDHGLVSLVDQLDSQIRSAMEEPAKFEVVGVSELLQLLQSRIDRRNQLLHND